MSKTRILVVDDERLIRWSIQQRLEEAGYDVLEATTGRECEKALDRDVHVVVLDYLLPDMDGFELLARIRSSRPDLPVIMLTAHSSIDHAVQAMKLGAFHYTGKPFDVDRLAALVGEASARFRPQANRPSREAYLDQIVGESKPMRRVKELLARVASSPSSTVLLTGESGTGKDLAARAIHHVSERAHGPFMNITCSALPSTLLESELFGHERGAFTDAKREKKGLLEQAHTGTVFLDEVGEMEPLLQAKLLRFLEEKAFRRVGGSTDIRPDVRVIAATNVDLKNAVQSGAFREDLYYRLAVLTVELPPLRARGDDLALLVDHFVRGFNREFGKNVLVASGAIEALRVHPWPGNLRELRNVVERAMLLADGDLLDEKDFASLRSDSPPTPLLRLPPAGINLKELERELVMQALERAEGNQTRAGAMLGMNRDQIRYRISKYNVTSGRR